ncbi:MAG: DUF5343 domain-containing protein [Gemmatimonadales bacterium]|nr:DUF5343 domain-containing protein [Gemmatimonadales bacterium]MBP9896997.1 DUF5343 domain-containing protein [Gemmatimonadales bacterium]
MQGYRDRGLAKPFTPDVLVRAGVTDSLVPRVLNSLEAIGLIDEAGFPTPALDGLRRATTEEFPARLAEIVREAYSEVFAFTDPATDDAVRVADAFRAFTPPGQRGRMVTLFIGLCEAAGIVPVGAKKSVPARSGASPRPKATAAKIPKTGNPGPPSHHPSFRADKANLRNTAEEVIHPAIGGMLASLPGAGTGWTQAQRDKWMRIFEGVLDFAIPIGEATPAQEPSLEELLGGK